jgi:hypothetical protein
MIGHEPAPGPAARAFSTAMILESPHPMRPPWLLARK